MRPEQRACQRPPLPIYARLSAVERASKLALRGLAGVVFPYLGKFSRELSISVSRRDSPPLKSARPTQQRRLRAAEIPQSSSLDRAR